MKLEELRKSAEEWKLASDWEYLDITDAIFTHIDALLDVVEAARAELKDHCISNREALEEAITKLEDV